ncbi:MAG: 30S ribosomal protein S4 [archaeon]
MGEPKRLNRQFDVPRKLHDKQKMVIDRKLEREYGLKTKKEIWKAETVVRNYRKLARNLLAGNVDNYDKRMNELLGRLQKIGMFTKDHTIDDVLKLQASDILERRLQTQVFRRGLALTPKQARQLITHGHIIINGVKRTAPGSLVHAGDSIAYIDTSIKAAIDRAQEQKGKPFLKDKPKEVKKEESE